MSSLTRFPAGSLRELISVATPLIISNLSLALMQLCDRIFIARFDLEAISGVAITTMIAWTFAYSFAGVTSISATFAGQYNGAKEYKKVSTPIWQMVYFSLALSIITIPIGMFSLDFFYNVELQKTRDFFMWTVGSAFLFPLSTAISCFYMSIGNTKIVTYTSVIANTANVFLDILFVFGYPNALYAFGLSDNVSNSQLIPTMGAKGAAIATVLSQILQISILITIMLSRKYKTKYATFQFTFNRKLLLNCIRFGFPNAVSRFVEMMAWSTISLLISNYSKLHIQVFAISCNLWIAFQFVFVGIQAGLSTTVANHIGAERLKIISKSIINAMIFFALIMFCCVPILVMFPDFAIGFFTGGSTELNPELNDYLIKTFDLTYIAIIIQSANLILTGALVAGGDTKFIMFTNPVFAWILAVIPAALTIEFSSFPPHATIAFTYPYMVVLLITYIWRYKSGKWINKVT